MKLINDCLTGPDGKSYDISRVGLAIILIAFLLISFYSLYVDLHYMNIKDWSFSAASILGAGGVGIGLKGHTEPPFGGPTP